MNFMQGFKILQLKIPKTASSSIERGITELVRKVPSVSKARSYGHDNTRKINHPNAYFIASVRNPYDRLLSAYQYIIENKEGKLEHKYIFKFGSFQKFALHLPEFAHKNRFFHPQCNWLRYHTEPNYDFLIRYENLQEDWNTLVSKFTEKSISLPHLRPSKHEHWDQMYNSRMRDLVYEFYRNDFKLLNYQK